MKSFLGVLLMTSFVSAELPMKNCECKDCKCTQEKHCGCFSNEGCKCSTQDACSENEPRPCVANESCESTCH